MEILTFNSVGQVRKVTRNGRSYLVAPMTIIVPGVLAGSKGALYYPPEECARNVQAWDSMPITVGHPTHPLNGSPVSATHPSVTPIGFLANTRFNGKLRTEGWFDAETTKHESRDIWNSLQAGQPIELSTGLYTENEPNLGQHNGKSYEYIARNYRPDHLAVLTSQTGACSVQDGCGVLVNANPEGRNQYSTYNANQASGKAEHLSVVAKRASRKNASQAHADAAKAHEEAAEANQGYADHMEANLPSHEDEQDRLYGDKQPGSYRKATLKWIANRTEKAQEHLKKAKEHRGLTGNSDDKKQGCGDGG